MMSETGSEANEAVAEKIYCIVNLDAWWKYDDVDIYMVLQGCQAASRQLSLFW